MSYKDIMSRRYVSSITITCYSGELNEEYGALSFVDNYSTLQPTVPTYIVEYAVS